MKEFLGVVVVTRNHEATIGQVLQGLAAQTEPADRVVVVDCGSDDTSWAADWMDRPGFEVLLLGENAGFTGGNNRGWRELGAKDGWVLFLNPDVLLPPDLFQRLREVLANGRAKELGAISIRLMGWDFSGNRLTGAVDSTGVFPVWSGWRDRGETVPAPRDEVESVPALCGAFFMARVGALREVMLPGEQVWDDRYFAYKEDIELSLRLRRAGWRLGVWHGAEGWHGRGWQQDRRRMPREARLLSARNEVRLHATYAQWRVPVSVAKWMAVRLLNL